MTFTLSSLMAHNTNKCQVCVCACLVLTEAEEESCRDEGESLNHDHLGLELEIFLHCGIGSEHWRHWLTEWQQV